MEYNSFNRLSLSRLGLGNMRLPNMEGRQGGIDEPRARELIEAACEAGVNYFDTAYRYHGGKSEAFVGAVLSRHPRDRFYLATKMPGHMMDYRDGKLSFQGYLAGLNVDSPAQIFEEQLEKCRVDWFDFYLLHNLCETSYGFYTNEDLGLVAYLLEQKKKGRIRHLGFSSHGRADTIERFLDWGEGRFGKNCFEFAQIQLNYLDWRIQDGKRKYDRLTARGVPVIVMEPCRGGKLAGLDAGTEAAFKKLRPGDSIASWAFRFVKSLPNVLVTLSGMTTLEQLEDNVKTFSGSPPLTEAETAALQEAAEKMGSFVPCTGCRYCCEECPQKLDIPALLAACNEMSMGKAAIFLQFTLPSLKSGELPSACTGCGACKRVCPQGIDIPGLMGKMPALIEKQKTMPDAW